MNHKQLALKLWNYSNNPYHLLYRIQVLNDLLFESESVEQFKFYRDELLRLRMRGGFKNGQNYDPTQDN